MVRSTTARSAWARESGGRRVRRCRARDRPSAANRLGFRCGRVRKTAVHSAGAAAGPGRRHHATGRDPHAGRRTTTTAPAARANSHDGLPASKPGAARRALADSTGAATTHRCCDAHVRDDFVCFDPESIRGAARALGHCPGHSSTLFAGRRRITPADPVRQWRARVAVSRALFYFRVIAPGATSIAAAARTPVAIVLGRRSGSSACTRSLAKNATNRGFCCTR